MYFPYDEKMQIYPQDDGFLMRKPWDESKIPEEKRHLLYENYHPLFVYRQKMAKQADAILGMLLHSNYFTNEELKRNYDFYQTVTLHHSSLSTCIFGILASQIGYDDEAYKYFSQSARMDLDDIHNNFYAGIHAANMAGTWQGIVFGFAGVRSNAGYLQINPKLPGQWKSYEFRLQYKGSSLNIKVTDKKVEYTLLNAVIGLATGETPIGTYNQLVDWYEKGDIDFSEARTVNLDEYKGLPAEHEQSYRYFMNKYLFDRINIKKENTHLPNGMAIDVDAECERYENVIKSVGGIDMQLLGIGLNGHIGFNEPGESFEKTTHCVELTQSTIDANSRLFHEGEKVPEKAFSMGIKSIMQSKQILLIANGEKKAQIVKDALFGPVTPKIPASILQLHNNLTVIVDKDAAKYL